MRIWTFSVSPGGMSITPGTPVGGVSGPEPLVKKCIAGLRPFKHPIPILHAAKAPRPAFMRRNDYDVSDSVRTTDAAAVGAEVVRLFKGLYRGLPAPELER